MATAALAHSAPEDPSGPPMSRQEAVSTLLKAPGKLFALLKTLFSGGAWEIETAFEHKGEQHLFRTLVQADADMIHFFPNFVPLAKDKAFMKLLAEKSAEHSGKIRGLLDVFEQNRLFWMRAIDATLVLVNGGAVAYAASEQSYESVVFTALGVSGSVFYSLKGKEWTFRGVMKLLFAILRKFL